MSKRSLAKKQATIVQDERRLELIPSDTDSRSGTILNVQDSVIGLRWCVSKAVTDFIEANDILNPMILVSVVSIEDGNEREMLRKLVLLTEMMFFVPFLRPGKNRIVAAIVYPKTGNSISDVKKEILSRSGSSYSHSIFDYESYDKMRLSWGDKFKSIKKDGSDDYSCSDTLCTYIDFDVPAEFFAKEPPEWEKKWVNLFFDSKAIDHCEYERRRILAYTVQPIFVFVINAVFLPIKYSFALLCIFIAVFRGVVDFDWDDVKDNFIHPWNSNVKDIWHEAKKSKTFWKYKRNNPHNYYIEREKSILPWIRPSILAIYVIVGLAIWALGVHVIPFWLVFTIIGSVVLVAFLAMLLIGAIVSESAKQTRLNKLNQRKAESALQERNELSYLVCTTDTASLQPTVDALPKPKRTFKLRAFDFKRGHCKPYAR